MSRICNEDCLHCPYEDCICEEAGSETLQMLEDFYAESHHLTADQIRREYNRREGAAVRLEHYTAHKDEINARRR